MNDNDDANERANEETIRRMNLKRLAEAGIFSEQPPSTPDPSAEEWRMVKSDSRYRIVDQKGRSVAFGAGDNDAERQRHATQIVADHTAVPRLVVAATRTTERLSDLPRYLETNGMGTLASVVEDCLTELRDATTPSVAGGKQ